MKARAGSTVALLASLLVLAFGCRTAPVPPEVEEAVRLDKNLWRAGASFFAADEFRLYRDELRRMTVKTDHERARFGPFRDFRTIEEESRALAARGRDLLERVRILEDSRRESLLRETDILKERVSRLHGMTRYFNGESEVRSALAQAEIKLAETDLLVQQERFEGVEKRIGETASFVEKAEILITDLLERYLDPAVQKTWTRWADEAAARSRQEGTTVFLIGKLERALIVLRGGKESSRFDIGLGKNGLSDKVYQGDEATPEGHYRIIKKYPESPFYKALLIDYPREEDVNAFAAARKNKQVPAGARDAGGAIEIHGGGKGSITKGCVGLDNKDMDEVYRAAAVGTPVTIVGMLSVEESILGEIKKFKKKAL